MISTSVKADWADWADWADRADVRVTARRPAKERIDRFLILRIPRSVGCRWTG
jgi:hypothetical protein